MLLWTHKDSMTFLIFILITEFNFLKLQGLLHFLIMQCSVRLKY